MAELRFNPGPYDLRIHALSSYHDASVMGVSPISKFTEKKKKIPMTAHLNLDNL